MKNIIIHAHFYQPPRADVLSGLVPVDPTAFPSHDWDSRITAECYKPNASARLVDSRWGTKRTVNNYNHISFNMGATLHRFLEQEEPALEALINSAPGSLAQAYNHVILPLASERDKRFQVYWGCRDFQHRTGRPPKGMWLPETAVDTATLEVLCDFGIKYTILSDTQCQSVTKNGNTYDASNANFDTTIPYICDLPSGRKITILFYNGAISRGIAFEGLLNSGDRFYERLVNSAPSDDGHFLLVATDGESYGHHHKYGEMALARVVELMEKNPDAKLTNINEFLSMYPAKEHCVIKENTSWSCCHGIERWRSNCGCHTGGEPWWNQKWRGPLRDAMNNLANKLDKLYDETTKDVQDREALLLQAVGLELEENSIEDFVKIYLSNLEPTQANNIILALMMQKLKNFSFVSCAWFFNDISGVETKQAIYYACFAARIAREISGVDYLTEFVADLAKVIGNTKEFPTASAIALGWALPKIDTELSSYFALQNQKDSKYKNKIFNYLSIGGLSMNYEHNLANSFLDTLEKDPAFRNVAYFSMEIGLSAEIPTYSGGLGILAGDILKSAADLGVPAVAVTLLYKKGYFTQKIKNGKQTELDTTWEPNNYLRLLPHRVALRLEGRVIEIAAWCYTLSGADGHTLPIYFLDTDLPNNAPEDRELTAKLYGGDNRYRLMQELILGMGGLRFLRDAGYSNINTFHLNEGHAGFITLELMRERGYNEVADKVKEKVVFTTHTPVPAGHDYFSYELIDNVLGHERARALRRVIPGEGVSMTDLAMKFSRYINGVSKKHAFVSRDMFHNDAIDWITNGVHSTTWTSPAFARLYDNYIPGWRNDPSRLMQALTIPKNEIWKAHQAQKMKLLAYVLEETGIELSPEILTIGFARRAATYKRATLIFSDIKRLLKIAKGKVQLIFAGKAHPKDEPGKDLIAEIYKLAKESGTDMPLVFLENYNMNLGKLLTSGVDVWLNTPMRPHEASGTSGMKAIHNGVINFSILDGWWIEGCIENVTGWAIGPDDNTVSTEQYDSNQDAEDLYNKLENVLIPTYYNNKDKWIEIARNTIAINASYFNTHRVVKEYCEKAYHTKFRGH